MVNNLTILLTNDDGWGTQGITTLYRLLQPLGNVLVVAPDGPRSSFSNKISMTEPMTLKQLDENIYVTSGTPADCVKLALNIFFDDDPSQIDLIVSGINHGSNASINVIYSGTIGACLTGCEHGIKGIGFSIDDHNNPTDLSHMEPYILPIIQNLLSKPWKEGLCYNVNAPVGDITGYTLARQARGHWAHDVQPSANQNGLYETCGYFVNDEPDTPGTDVYAMAHQQIAIQPCTADLTYYAALR